MRKFIVVAILASGLAGSAGCGKSAGAGENWIFYSYEEVSTDSKGTTRSTVQECINIKFISQASYYAATKVDGKEIKLHGKDADGIWKSLQSNN